MKLGYPWCHRDERGRAHVREPMRLEVPNEGARAIWRCPTCWRSVLFMEEPPLDDLCGPRDVSFAMVTNELAAFGGPVMVEISRTDDPRLVELVFTEAA
jgi:hypothetical protein